MSSWRSLLQAPQETLVLPWLGGRDLRFGHRGWYIEGAIPREHAWCKFSVDGRKAKLMEICEPAPEVLREVVRGYLIGDLLIPLGASALEANVLESAEQVHLIPPGLDRFTLVSAGRVGEGMPLVFVQEEMPLGPETDVQNAFLDGVDLLGVSDVSPALEVAFKLANWQRVEAARRRAELEAQRAAEAERLRRETLQREVAQRLGDGAGRREMAALDFEAAARAALTLGGAEYLDHRASPRANEMVVRFRLIGRRFECTCDRNTLQIIDSGICLVAHDHRDGFAPGTRGDTWFTLESLPAVILDADQQRRLVVFRHVDYGDRNYDHDEDYDDEY